MEVAGCHGAASQLKAVDAQSARVKSTASQDSAAPRSRPGRTSNQDERIEGHQEQRDLERRTTEIIEAMNDCNFKHPVLEHLVPDFKSDRETIEGVECQPTSKAEYFNKHRMWALKVPTRTMTVLHVVSDFDEIRGKASVWVWLNITGWGSARMCAESVSCFKWQKSQGVWWCHQHSGMRGTPPLQASYW